MKQTILKGAIGVGILAFILFSVFSISDSSLTGYAVFEENSLKPAYKNMNEYGNIKNGELYNKEITMLTQNAYDGLVFFGERPGHKIYLMRNDGEVLQFWNLEGRAIRLNYPFFLAGGNLLFFDQKAEQVGVIDKNSDIVWTANYSGHHDATLVEDMVVLPVRSARYSEILGYDILDERITFLNVNDGSWVKDISLYDIIIEKIDLERRVIESGKYVTDGGENNETNIFHMNGLYFIDQDYNELFTKGRILASLRSINTVVLIDIGSEKIVWEWGHGILDGTHNPSVSRAGNLLLFENGHVRGYSRVLEVNPISGEIVWSYNNDSNAGLFSGVMGSVQELANGNILITESTEGRAVEIDRFGEIQWEYLNSEEYRIFKLQKLDENCVVDVFEGKRKSSLECLR